MNGLNRRNSVRIAVCQVSGSIELQSASGNAPPNRSDENKADEIKDLDDILNDLFDTVDNHSATYNSSEPERLTRQNQAHVEPRIFEAVGSCSRAFRHRIVLDDQ